MRRSEVQLPARYLCKTHLGRDTEVVTVHVGYTRPHGEHMFVIMYKDPLSPDGRTMEVVRAAKLRPITRKISGERNERSK